MNKGNNSSLSLNPFHGSVRQKFINKKFKSNKGSESKEFKKWLNRTY